MKIPPPDRFRLTVRTLQAAMMTQIIVGLTRFLAPLLGWNLPGSVWRIHPALGAAIAVAVGIVLRPQPDATPTAMRRLARIAPLAPLALGLVIWIGPFAGPWLVPLHMAVGITALGVVDNALKHLLAARPSNREHVLSSAPPS